MKALAAWWLWLKSRQWPVRVNRRHQCWPTGYELAYRWGRPAKVTFVPHDSSQPTHTVIDYNPVKLEIWVASWVIGLLALPERTWRHILARLWHDRLNLQYERGYTEGLREASTEEFQRIFKSLTPAEREALLAEPSHTRWGDHDD